MQGMPQLLNYGIGVLATTKEQGKLKISHALFHYKQIDNLIMDTINSLIKILSYHLLLWI